MDQCDQHGECLKKIMQICSDLAVLRSRIDSHAEQLSVFNETIFGMGDSQTLKSRLQRAEDGVSGLEEKVLENRVLVSTKIDELVKSTRSWVIILITAATMVVGGMFGLLWAEIQSVQTVSVK